MSNEQTADYPLTPSGTALLALVIAERNEARAKVATLLQRCADLTAARDAWQEQALAALTEERRLLHDAANVPYETILATDATDPGPQLVAETREAVWAPVRWVTRAEVEAHFPDPNETRAAFPARALRGGDGVPR
jgi:hypothetical protein